MSPPLAYKRVVSKKRVTTDEIYSMEESEYRDLMRGELAKARRNYTARAGHAGSVVISLILVIAGAAVILHYFGFIELPK
jgi:hypothetical protein